MPARALQHFARMRGGAQGQLLLADDGEYYVVKFQNNPQHRRVLANEWLAHGLLKELALPTPAAEIVRVSAELIESTPSLYIEAGGRRLPCAAGPQFGSRYPGDPSRVPVYDYLPDALLRQVTNVDAFLGMAVFDKWVSNANGRQAIFFRDPSKGDGRGWVANMIDHGFAFTAQNWEFRDPPLAGIYPRPWLYERVTGYDSFEPWLSGIKNLRLEALDQAQKRIEPQWYDGDIAALDRLIEQLFARRRLVPDLLRAAKRASRDPFPNWR